MHITVFRNRKRADMDTASYAVDTERLVELASRQTGFLAYRRYTSEDGEALSIAEWETEEDARAWGRHSEHLAAQGRGRRDYYESYTIYSCTSPRINHFDRSDS